MKRTVASRSIGRGLAKVEPGSANTLIAFAAEEAERIRLAALAPSGPAIDDSNARGSSDAIAKSLVSELRRVGCASAAAIEGWNDAAQKALAQYNRHAGTKFDIKVASLDALQSVRERSAGICPLVCEHGFEASGGKCVKIVCGKGFALSDDNACERVAPQKNAKPATASTPKPRTAPGPEVRQPEQGRPRSAAKNMEAIIQACQFQSGGRGRGGARGQNRNFQRLDACIRGRM